MSFIRVTEPNVADVPLEDLGITIAQNTSNQILSDQFTMNELIRSASLEAAIQGGDLTVDIDYGIGFTAVGAGAYTNRDTLGAFANIFEISNEDDNEDLVDGSDASSLHIHDGRYFTESELGAGTGAALIGADDTNCPTLTFSDVQTALEQICAAGETDLDGAYDNDSDGIMNIDGTTKPFETRSNNGAGNDPLIVSRDDASDIQQFLIADLSADELILGAAAVGGHNAIDVRILTDLIVVGDITFTGTITDTTVANMNVTNNTILLNDGAATGTDASIEVERGATGADACITWNETSDRWQVGIIGTKFNIARQDFDEDITGNWLFTGGGTTSPSFAMKEKACATPPTIDLGSATEIPFAVMDDGNLYSYDKSNSRDKWLSVHRENLVFTGRNVTTNKDEYLWMGRVNTQRTGWRAATKSTIVGIKVQIGTAATTVVEIRKNGSASVIASVTLTAVVGNQDLTLDVDLAVGDYVQVFLNSSAVLIESPIVEVEVARNCVA